MSICQPCKALKECLKFADFQESLSVDQLFQSTAQTISVVCANGSTVSMNVDAGLIGYVQTFSLATPPYPNLVLNCSGGQIIVPVPSGTSQAQLTALITGMLNTCLQQIVTSIGCTAGTFYNTAQTYNPCTATGFTCTQINGQVPSGVTPVAGGSKAPGGLSMSAGTILSTVSVADANAKALQVLGEVYLTGNAECLSC